MEFFNKKEEVLEIKLTPFGRYKLSRGLLKPTHYAFFDEGVLYNSVLSGEGVTTATDPQGGFIEKQNEIEARIQENTPSIKPFNVITGSATSLLAVNEAIRSHFDTHGHDLLDDPLFMNPGDIYNQDELQPASVRTAFMTRPLGKSRLNSDKYPAWSTSMLQGDIESSTATISTDHGVEKIPQIEIQLKYNIYVEEAPGINTPQTNDTNGVSLISERVESIFTNSSTTNNVQSLTTELFGDNYIVVERNDAVLEITEYNTDFYKENFDIEVFLMGDEFPGGKKVLQFNNDPLAAYTDGDVQYYLNLRVDGEIEQSLAQKLGIAEATGFATDSTDGAVSTRDYFIKDLYIPEEDLCE